MMIAAKFRFRSRLGVFFGLLVVMAPPILEAGGIDGVFTEASTSITTLTSIAMSTCIAMSISTSIDTGFVPASA
jgi:hypothetical protein